MTEKYEKGWIAVDAVIFTIYDQQLKVLLHEREKEPFKGLMELPGGLLLPNETAEETLKRKLHEITGQHKIFFQQFSTFTTPKRDPRERAVSIGFIALISKEKVKGLEGWHYCSKLPQMAFDHKEIIEQAKKYLKENISARLVKQFMPDEFPLNKLQEIYEIIKEKTYDNRNFRKKMICACKVEETGKMETNVSHRPAKLFRFKK
jgi:8-oxo-dGTP diphosphatase